MGWFEKLTGFRELSYEETRAKLRVDGHRLHSLANGKSWAIGNLEMASLRTLRERVGPPGASSGRLRASIVRGDVKALHAAPEYVGALFQAASQFNALEMTGPEVTPERGVAGDEYDHTQGPACAVAAGAATIYRNYFVPVAGGIGQTAERQLNGLAGVGAALSKATGKPVAELWDMRNGYAMCDGSGMDTMSDALGAMDARRLDDLRGELAIAVHTGVEVTVGAGEPGPLVSQALCAALPIGYFNFPDREARSKTFASLVLEATYEATMLAAVLNARRGSSKIVLLTLVGGGVFANEEAWILGAMRRAFRIVSDVELDARIVCYVTPSSSVKKLVAEFA